MNLRINVFGVEVASLELDIPAGQPQPATIVEKTVQATSKWWMKWMVR